jgi:hypothetical protein
MSPEFPGRDFVYFFEKPAEMCRALKTNPKSNFSDGDIVAHIRRQPAVSSFKAPLPDQIG